MRVGKKVDSDHHPREDVVKRRREDRLEKTNEGGGYGKRKGIRHSKRRWEGWNWEGKR
jgi:hypothetical protein